MRGLAVAGCLVFAVQLIAGYFLHPAAPGAAPHLGLGVGFAALGLLLLWKPSRATAFVGTVYLILTIAGRIHFLVSAGPYDAATLAPAAAFLLWAGATAVWLLQQARQRPGGGR